MELYEFEPPKATERKGWTPQLSPEHIIVEKKLDGVRAIVHCSPEGVVITSRKKSKKTGKYNRLEDKVPHLKHSSLLNKLGGVGYTILDGEITLLNPNSRDSRNKKVNSTMTVLGSSPEIAIEKQGELSLRLHLTIFDVVRWRDADVTGLSLRERRRLLLATDMGDEPNVSLIRSLIVRDPDKRKSIADKYISQGEEGAIFKDPRAGYFDSGAWIKRKGTLTVDGLITGWTDGQGKFLNTVGSVKCSAYDEGTGNLREFCHAAPGDNARRDKLYNLFVDKTDEEIVGMDIIVEVEAQCWTSGGRLRHPRVIRYRGDRNTPNTIKFDGEKSRVI